MKRRAALAGLSVLGAAMALRSRLCAVTPVIDPCTAAQVVSADDLARMASKPAAERPVIVCVGFEFLYHAAHVPGAVFHGPGGEAKGLKDLQKFARNLQRDKEIVLYCGCCPFAQCPNIRPAFSALRQMGFVRLKAAQIDHDFARDWVDRGLPVEKGT